MPSAAMTSTPTKLALRIAAPYAAISALWILGSDHAVNAFVTDTDTREWLSIYKGWAFVAVTATLLVLSLRTQFGHLAAAERERLAAVQAAQLSDDRFREIADTIGEVFWAASPDLATLHYLSPGVERVWGIARDEFYRTPARWFDAVVAEDRDRVAAAVADPVERLHADLEYRIRHRDGDVRWIHLRSYPQRDAAGAVIGICGVASDVTARRGLEAQLLRAQKLEAMGTLAGGVAHDFNNILTVILANGAMLRDGDADPEAAAEIVAAAERASGLTRQLLLFSRRQSLEPRDLDLGAVVAELTKMLRRLVGEDVTLTCVRGGDLPAIRADAGMLEQVVMNLVVNARDAMPRGGPITITTAPLTLDDTAAAARGGAARAGAWVTLVVADGGTGISADALPHIFEPFFTTKAVGQGTGLGLSTVYGIVAQHGGWIDVTTGPTGTTFTIALPPAAPAVRPGPSAPSSVDDLPRGTEQVLLVEDEEPVRRAVTGILRACGYQIHAAASGAEALEAWPALRAQIDLVITDVIMPGGMTGVELAARLTADRPDLALVFTSGYRAAGATDELPAGATFVPKPFDRARLATAVRRALDARAARAA
jgi:two-component system cell cycle sensor histidine kinase/response regulator CckA